MVPTGHDMINQGDIYWLDPIHPLAQSPAIGIPIWLFKTIFLTIAESTPLWFALLPQI